MDNIGSAMDPTRATSRVLDWESEREEQSTSHIQEADIVSAFIFAKAVLFDRKSTHDTQCCIVHGTNKAGNNAAARFMPESNAAVV
jgi:hypothetical protein